MMSFPAFPAFSLRFLFSPHATVAGAFTCPLHKDVFLPRDDFGDYCRGALMEPGPQSPPSWRLMSELLTGSEILALITFKKISVAFWLQKFK